MDSAALGFIPCRDFQFPHLCGVWGELWRGDLQFFFWVLLVVQFEVGQGKNQRAAIRVSLPSANGHNQRRVSVL